MGDGGGDVGRLSMLVAPPPPQLSSRKYREREKNTFDAGEKIVYIIH